MSQLTHSPATRLSAEFDDFLFARIGHDANGMPLTVLSALARSDLDPWDEAERLAGLPEKFATARLTALFEKLRDQPSVATGYKAIAAQLVALLPRRTMSDAALLGTPRIFKVTPQAWVVVCVVLLVVALGADWITANTQAHATAVTAAQTVMADPSAVSAPEAGQAFAGGTL